jgi:hypothetical protein
MRKRTIAITLTKILLTLGIVVYLAYDPTMRCDETATRIQHVINTTMPDSVRIIQVCSESVAPAKCPFWVRYHPRNLDRPQNGLSGTANGSWAYLIESPRGKIRCYSHFFRGYTSAFTILYSAGTQPDAKLLAAKLRGAFPLLPVTIQESKTLTIAEPRTEM